MSGNPPPPQKSSQPTSTGPDYPRELLPTERFWRDIQPWLQTKGYMLRPRYMPDWKPSWNDHDNEWRFEDAAVCMRKPIMDATRILDGELVVLKRVSTSRHPHELELTQFFSNEPIRSHPRNHCIPLLDSFELPDRPADPMVILVLPLLRVLNDPPMKSVGETMEFFRQVFEGVQFMHSCHIAHRDLMDLNIMMDPKPMYPNMFHPTVPVKNRNFRGKAKHYTRTARPTKYYIIDFGLSRQYDPTGSPPLELPIFGGDKSVPEFKADFNKPINPFHTDIYYIGNMIREDFLQKTQGLEIITSLVADMTQDDPEKRPDIDEVISRFATILGELHWWTLRSRLVYNDESSFKSFRRHVAHWITTTGHILLFRRALPTPPQA
ncbi:kinase-like domain-containing protein [Abortiporus biennis]|nr:kinase-like domain-containing protein [Abortiporus biennis]